MCYFLIFIKSRICIKLLAEFLEGGYIMYCFKEVMSPALYVYYYIIFIYACQALFKLFFYLVTRIRFELTILALEEPCISNYASAPSYVLYYTTCLSSRSRIINFDIRFFHQKYYDKDKLTEIKALHKNH